MLSFIRNLSLKWKFILILLFPFIGFLFFAGQSLTSGFNNLGSNQDIQQLSIFSEKISNLVHELQKERGMSAGYTGSKGVKFRNELNQQRRLTDESQEILKKQLGIFDFNNFQNELKIKTDLAVSLLTQIVLKRQNISDLSLPLADVVAYYTNMNSHFLDIINLMSGISTNANINSEIAAYFNLMQAKERSGIERAVLNGVFAKGFFNSKEYTQFVTLVASQDIYIAVFKSLSKKENWDYFKRTVSGPEVSEVDRMRVIAKDVNIDRTRSFNVDASIWFMKITSKINLLKQTENYLIDGIKKHADDLTSQIKNQMITTSIFTIIAIIISIFLALFTMKIVISCVTETRDVALELAEGEGDLTKRMQFTQDDELGELGAAINKMLENLAQMIKKVQVSSESLGNANVDLKKVADVMTQSSESTVIKSNTVASAAEEMNSNMLTIAAAMEQSTTNINSVSTSIGDMSDRMTEILENTNDAKSNANTTVEKAKQASEQMNLLGTAAEEIGDVSETIRDVSDKTDLLALNATIEAARAGETGKGFAVVANEIKDLAKQTASATANIALKLQAIQKSTKVAITEIEDVTGGIYEVAEIIGSITDKVALQQQSSMEVSENIGQASNGLQEVNSNVTQSTQAAGQVAQEIGIVNESANEINQSCAQVDQSATDLNELANHLTDLVGKFKV